MTVNQELLYETLDAVIAADTVGDWEQGNWVVPSRSQDPGSCGTAACFAGWRAILDGVYLDGMLVGRQGGHKPRESIRMYAENRLGLTPEQDGSLFSGGNTLEDLKYMVNAIAGGHDGRALLYEAWAAREEER
jgi:hypothetical protein